MFLRGIGRIPTLMVAQSANNSVGRFGFRTRLLRPVARKTGTEVEFERNGYDESSLRHENFAGTIDARAFGGDEGSLIPLVVEAVEFEVDAKTVRADVLAFVLGFDAGEALD